MVWTVDENNTDMYFSLFCIAYLFLYFQQRILLLDADMNIKIADFGFSNEFTMGTKLDTFVGVLPMQLQNSFKVFEHLYIIITL